MKKLDKRLIRLIKGSLGQVIAVSIIMIVGLMTYTAFKISALNLETTVIDYYRMTNFADMYIDGVSFTKSTIDGLKNKYGVSQAEGRIVRDIPMITDKDENITIRAISMDGNRPERINKVYLEEGTLPSYGESDGVVIRQFASARNISVGSYIKLQISGREYRVRITGIIESPEYIYAIKNEQTLLPNPKEFGVIFMDEEFLKKAFNTNNTYNQIVLKTQPSTNLDVLEDRMDRRLSSSGVKRIIKRENQLSNRMISEEIKQLKSMARIIPVLFLSISGLILFAMISRLIKKDRTTIGVMKALGYSRLQIIAHYIKFNLFIGLIGSSIGANLGMAMAGGMTKLYLQYFHIPILRSNYYIRYVFIAIALSSLFCIVSGLLGSLKILSIMPSESMRPPSPRIGKPIFLERIKWFWKRQPFSWKMVYKNIFRSKKRFAFILIGVSLSYGLILMTLYQFDTIFKIFLDHYGEFQTMDYSVAFSAPQNEDVTSEIKELVDVDNIEGFAEFPFEIESKWKSRVVNIIGLHENTKFYNIYDVKGRPITHIGDGILISENLSKSLDVDIGDRININTFLPYKQDIEIRVENIIKQGLGINGYMHIEVMQDRLLDSQLVTGVYIDSKDDIKGSLKGIKKVESVQSLQDLSDMFMQFLSMTYVSITIMIIFSGLLGFAVVYTSTVIGISERKREFSSLRVMGYRRKEIFNMILRENAVMSVFGILVGIPIGHTFIGGMKEAFSNDLYTISGSIQLKSYMVAGLLTVCFVVVAQLFMLRKIYKLNFIDALKNRVS